MSVILFKDLPKIRQKHKCEQIIYCSGCFDLLHAGHIIFFEDCKKNGGILVVGIGSDKSINIYKGKDRPVLNQHIRLKMLDSLKTVDYVFVDLDDGYRQDNSLYGVEIVLEKLRPDCYAFNDDAYDIPRREKIARKHKVNVKILKRWCPDEFENISTTKIIEKIKNLK